MRRMSDAPASQPHPSTAMTDIPDRLCTWCKIPMTKRLVGGGAFIHYTCPTCVFQHASKRQKP
jgi:hypothetical protein